MLFNTPGWQTCRPSGATFDLDFYLGEEKRHQSNPA
jgi:hypothetical protein